MLGGRDRSLLYRQLGEMCRAGLPIERVFTVASEARRGTTARALALITDHIRTGASLEVAFNRVQPSFPGIFARWETRFIGFGERSGQLPDFLVQVADQVEENHRMTMEILGGFVYPLIMLYVSIMAGPVAKLILGGVGLYLDAVRGPLLGMTAVLAAVAVGLFHPVSRVRIMAALRPIPVFGKLLATASLYRLITGLALAYRGGLALDEAWPLAAEGSGDPRLIAVSRQIAHRIQAGKEVSATLDKHHNLFPESLRNAYLTGEATGRLDHELLHLAKMMLAEMDLMRKTAVKMTNAAFYVAVALYMGKNIADIYLGQLTVIDDALKGLGGL